MKYSVKSERFMLHIPILFFIYSKIGVKLVTDEPLTELIPKEPIMSKQSWIHRLRQEWRVYALALVLTVIAEAIGTLKFKVGPGLITLFPVFYTIVLGMLSGPQVAKLFDSKLAKVASKVVIVGICPFVVKLGISAGANLDMIVHAGPALLLHGFGNLLGIVFGLPLAMMLGMRREAIGATSSLNREYHLALINGRYGADSEEAQGSMAIYIVGGILGTIFFGLLASAFAMSHWFDPRALGMSTGVGAGIFMASASATLAAMMPQDATVITTMASAANTVVGITGIYITMFLAIPMTDRLYTLLLPLVERKRAHAAGIAHHVPVKE